MQFIFSLDRFFLQPIYVRAKTERERQEWLIALGSAKAAGGSSAKGSSSSAAAVGSASNAKIASPSLDPIAEANGHIPGSSAAAAKLKTRRSELRLYRDMLVQQVANIRDGADGQDMEVGGQ